MKNISDKNDQEVLIQFDKRVSRINLICPINTNNIFFSSEKQKLIISGYPRINSPSPMINIKDLIVHNKRLKDIDGSFLIIEIISNNSIKIITDRFLSKKIYIYNTISDIILGTNLSKLSKYIISKKLSLRINDNAIYEFLYFRRLFGKKTLFKEISLLEPATITNITNKDLEIHKYWHSEYSESLTDSLAAENLAFELRESVNSTFSENENFNLLLSGGLDARAILAAKNPKNCFTICPTRNNEAQVAELLSLTSNTPFKFIERIKKTYDDNYSECLNILDGEYAIVGLTFMGYKDQLRYSPNINSVFTLGLYLDVLFGGLYLPKTYKKIGSYETSIYKLDTLPDDITSYFINNVKYKMKNFNINSLINVNKLENVKGHLYNEIEKLIKEEKKYTNNPYNIWESLHFKPASRHYSYAMIKSIETFSKCKIPAFSNKLLDLSRQMTPEQKINSKVYKKAISILDSDLITIANANSNVRAKRSAYEETAIILLRKILKKYFCIRTKLPPRRADRSWVSVFNIIEENGKLKQDIMNLQNNKYINQSDIFSMDYIRNLVKNFENGNKENAILLSYMASLESFFKNIYKNNE